MKNPDDGTTSTISLRIWQQLECATTEKDHGWRKPVLATVDNDGMPQARTVVLREVSQIAQKLVLYTDARSPKVAQLFQSSHAVLVFWSESLAWQLRIEGTCHVDIDGLEVEQRWHVIRNTPAADDYLAARAPGLPLEDHGISQGCDHHHLAIISFFVNQIDWLALSREGHRRAIFSQNNVRWVEP